MIMSETAIVRGRSIACSLLIALVALLPVGCAQLPHGTPPPPTLTLERLELVQLGPSPPRLRFYLRASNQGGRTLTIDQLQFQLTLAGRPIAIATAQRDLTLDAGEQRWLSLLADHRIARQVFQLTREVGSDRLPFYLSGEVSSGEQRFPFEQRDAITIAQAQEMVV